MLNGIGVSHVTPDKEEGLDALLRLQMQIVKRVFAKNPWAYPKFVYIDANAGDGSNSSQDCDGSPVVFLKVAQDSGIDYHGYFIDIEPANTKRLESICGIGSHHTIMTGDNRTIVPTVLSRYHLNKTYGLLYADQNGIPDFDMLADVVPTQSRLDILIRCPATALKRNNQRLSEHLVRIRKSTWLIRDFYPNDKWQWTFLFGTNYTEFPEWVKHRFYKISSEAGLGILKRANLSADEIGSMLQSRLFDTPEKQALSRSGGVCESCHINPVTEPHHKRSGPDITADDIIAVCHPCHCKLEGVAN